MVKIYTKSGDRGKTSLFGGQKAEKSDLRIEAYGNVDELNSLIGTILAGDLLQEISKKMTRIQNELFVLGSDLATPLSVKIKIPRVSKTFITRLEKEIDAWQKNLPELRKFILPGGSKVGAKLHLARSTARRTERAIVRLGSHENINERDIIYIKRLSDWFFVLARFVNKLEKIKETEWKGRG